MNSSAQPSSRILRRPRVDDVFTDALTRPVSIVSAPLGYGKSVALGAYLEGQPHVAWYRAASWHAGTTCIAALCDAIRSVRPGFGARTDAFIERHSTGSILAEQFLLDLRHSHEALTIVIDDAHELEHDFEFHTFLAILAKTLQAPEKMVIVSRTVPAIDITLLTVADQLSFISTDALRFTNTEIADFAQARGCMSDGESVKTLMEKSGGWPAALSLMLDPMQKNHSPAASPENLAQRVLDSFSPPLREVLERAVIDSSWQADETSLQLIAREPVAVVDNHAHITVTPLIADAMRSALQKNQSRAIALHLEAAQKAECALRWRAALYHYEQAGACHLAGFLGRKPNEIVALGLGNHLTDILASLAESETDRASLAFLQALISQQRGSNEVTAFLDEAVHHVAPDNHALIFAITAKRLELQLGQGKAATPTDLKRLHMLASIAGRQAIITAALISGWSLIIAGEFTQAAAMMAPIGDAPNIKAAGDIAVLKALIHTTLGHPTLAQDTLDTILIRLEADDQLVLQARTLVWYTRLALMWGDTSAAFDAANEAIRRCELLSIETEFAPLYAACSEAASHYGEAVATSEAAAAASRYARGAWYSADAARIPAQADLFTARGFFLRDKITPAYMLACNVASRSNTTPAIRMLAGAESQCYALLLSNDQVTAYADTSIVHGIDAVDALAIATATELYEFLGTLHGKPATAKNYGIWTPLIASRAPSIALSVLGEAIARFRDAGDMRAASEAENVATLCALHCACGPRFEVLLALAIAKALVASNPKKTHLLNQAILPVGRLFTSGMRLFEVDHAPAKMRNIFTEREHELLLLLVQGLTNKEMATHFVISPRTVETHVERILSKLDTSTRARAIAKAIRLGIVTISDIP